MTTVELQQIIDFVNETEEISRKSTPNKFPANIPTLRVGIAPNALVLSCYRPKK
jgi:hypothetical protein